jgi:copper chaperone CopZ
VAVENVDGVREASFFWPEGTASVTYDTTRTSPEVFIAELTRTTGFGAEVRVRP